MNIKMLKSALAGLVLSVSGFANAGLIVDDSVGDGEWGTVFFNWTGGTIDINGFGDGYATGLTGVGADDIFFTLLENDGSDLSAFTGAFVTSNDDSNALGWDADGSTSGLDSYISNFNLNAGSYLLTISHCCTAFSGSINDNSGMHQGTNDYRISFSDGATLTSVPEPSTLAIFALGIMGLASRRFKKQS
ncbi:hypothetical protein A3Q33_14785 [Colwellia sp. PAMC 21821]|nr:hypothetical protein A3Q33_14785 [Colwellia sp. PAMC 21821]